MNKCIKAFCRNLIMKFFTSIIFPIALIIDGLIFIDSCISQKLFHLSILKFQTSLDEFFAVSFRGLMGTLAGLSTNVGALLASLIGMPQIFGTKNLWPLSYLVEMIPCLMLTCYAVFILHESPLYCLERMDELSAENAIQFYNNVKNSRQMIEQTKNLIAKQRDEKRQINTVTNWKKFRHDRSF